MFVQSSTLLFTVIALSLYILNVNSEGDRESNKFTYNLFNNVKDYRSRSSSTKATTNKTAESYKTPPHIIFILADDLGFNDVGFRGSSQIPTPNIDALAYSGIILNRYYVQQVCTPSRAALMTGKYPIHTGMQRGGIKAAEPRALPLKEKLMPEYFNKLGYSSHIAGKWHLGHYKRKYLPLSRGFRSHVGFWIGRQDYYAHTVKESGYWGLDMRDGWKVGYNLHGTYSTDYITNESLRVINHHNASQPLFLYVAHAAVHAADHYNPLPAPDEAVAKLKNFANFKRQKYAAMVTKLDDSVGLIVKELQKRNMLDNSIIIFSTDNGGPPEGMNDNSASNWPLKGSKNTLWEGGIRGAGLMWSPRIKKPQRVAEQTIQIADWLPTLLTAIKGDQAQEITGHLDGESIWDALINDEISPRRVTLHNIDNAANTSALMLGDWKVVSGTNYEGRWDNWFGPTGNRNPLSYDYEAISTCDVGRSLATLNMLPTTADIKRIRMESNVNCAVTNPHVKKGTDCKPGVAPCLFNIREDPCEKYNLANEYPQVLKILLDEVAYYNSTSVPALNQPIDPCADPSRWNYVWTNFGDCESYSSTMFVGNFEQCKKYCK